MKKKVIRILGKRTGIGNQIQFIPFILLLKKDYIVCSDSTVFEELGVELAENQTADINLTVFSYNYKNFWKERLKYKGKFYGFKYRIKRRHIGFGYNKAMSFDENMHEIDNNIKLYNNFFNASIQNVDYKIDGWKPEKNLVIIGISLKKEKAIPADVWHEIINEVEKRGFEVKTIDGKIGSRHINTPTISDLKKTLSKATYYIGTDSGVSHLADVLGIPSLIMFGATSMPKNKPYQEGNVSFSQNLPCSPCYDWGRVKCNINYQCMKFPVDKVMEQFDILVQNNKKTGT